MAASPSVFRFAPSPNGELHLGHALSAIVGHEMAQRSGGRFLLRIEDIDLARAREEFIDGIVADLRWLGITWEEPVLRQSQHFPVYRAAAHQLEDMGLLYPCFATRAEIAGATARSAKTDPDGAPFYPGLHRGLMPAEIAKRKDLGEPFALRLDMEKARSIARAKLGQDLAFIELDEEGNARTIAARPERWGDAVILRKEVPASYHLAVVVDDARQGVTHVTRGRDLYAATDLHRLLQVLLELPEPVYHHHRLVTDPAGRKLAKSAGDTSLRRLREAGSTPADIRERLGFFTGKASLGGG